MHLAPRRAALSGATALLLTLVCCATASAVCQNTYSGPDDGQWNSNANWSLNQFPTSSQDVCIPAGRSVQIIENGNAYAASVSIAAGAKVTMRTDPGFASTQAYFDDVDNAGTFEFVATGTAIDNDQNILSIAAGHTFANRGILRSAQGEGHTVIYGDVDNQASGTIQVNSWLRVLGSGGPVLWRNAGAVTVAASQTLSFESGWGAELRQTAGTFTNNGNVTFNNPADLLAATGGAFTGTPPLLHQGTLGLTGGTGTARIQYGNASLASDIGAGWTVRIEDRGSDTTRLRIPAGAARTNAGTIVFAKDPAPGATERVATSLDIGAGATLTNTGTIRADADVANGEQITAQNVSGQSYQDPAAFKQNGTLAVHHALTTPPFTQNGGTTAVDSGVRLTVGYPLQSTDPGLTLAAGTLSGNGNVAARKTTNSGGVVAPTPGGTPLTISYNNIYETDVAGGDYLQHSGGTLRTRLAALGTGLVVGGDAKLAGTWDIAPSAAYTPPAGQSYPVVRTTIPGSRRTGTFTTVTGAYSPTYELDGADVTVPGGASSLSVADVTVKEGVPFTFTVRRSAPATGSASVHWSVRDIGSAVAGADYPLAPGNVPMSGDLAFADGETEKTVTSIWTLDEGTPEPDETFQFHLSHPTTVRIARATATATIINDDSSLTSIAPNVLGDDGPTAVTLRGTGLTTTMTALLRHTGRPDVAPVSLTPSDDGLTAVAVFDTTGLTPLDDGWFIEIKNHSISGGYRYLSIQHATSAGRPFVQGTGPAFARGGLPTYDYLHYGNLGGSASRPAFLRLSGYPIGADLTVDHLPPGASASVYDGIAGRTVTVTLGRIAAKANDFVRVRYVPTTTIPGHTKLSLQASMSFGDAIAPPTDLRALGGATLLTPTGGDQLSANLAFSPSGSVHLRYAEQADDGSGPAVTHSGSTWTFRGTPEVVDASPRRLGSTRVAVPKTQGLVTVDFNGGEFKVAGPLQEVEGAYELSIDRRRLTECMKAYNLIDANDYDDLMRFADGAVVMKGMVTAAGASGTISSFAPQLGALDAVVSGAWEMRVAKGHTAILDQIANPKLGFDLAQDDEYQLLWLMQLCADRPDPDDAPEPVYENGNYVPSKYIRELLQSFDPNEKSGTQGGGAAHAIRSETPIRYRVDFQNLPAASAAAQTVKVTDQLDPAKVDLSTFSLGPIAFGDELLTPPNGVSTWTTTVDLRPAQDLLVKVEAALDTGTAKATWTFTSLDPATGQATTDALAGFLPPDTHPPAGEGNVSYAVSPKASIASGTTIGGDASIVFDTNAPIVTNVWSNLIDDVAPTGAVSSVAPGSACGALDVAWNGSDAASGVGSYDVWVSEDGDAWRPWRVRTSETAGSYPGTAGHAYRFDVQARDLAGNLQGDDRGDARSATATCTAPPPPPDGGGNGGGGGGTPDTGAKPGGATAPKGGPPPAPKPWVKLGKLPSKLRKGAVIVPVTCPATESAGCRGRLTLTTIVRKGKRMTTVTLGTAAFKVKAGKTAAVSVKLSKKALKPLRASRLTIALTARSSMAGDPRRTEARASVKRAR